MYRLREYIWVLGLYMYNVVYNYVMYRLGEDSWVLGLDCKCGVHSFYVQVGRVQVVSGT